MWWLEGKPIPPSASCELVLSTSAQQLETVRLVTPCLQQVFRFGKGLFGHQKGVDP